MEKSEITRKRFIADVSAVALAACTAATSLNLPEL
jgi:hypothetical protein